RRCPLHPDGRLQQREPQLQRDDVPALDVEQTQLNRCTYRLPNVGVRWLGHLPDYQELHASENLDRDYKRDARPEGKFHNKQGISRHRRVYRAGGRLPVLERSCVTYMQLKTKKEE